MTFDKLPGQENIKTHLKKGIENGRIPHAQIFSGNEGSGTLIAAISYANELLQSKSSDAVGSALKVSKLAHPDLHFVFPVSTTDKVKRHPISGHFMEEWRTFVLNQNFGDYYDWLKHLGVDKKQAQIGVDEAEDLLKKINLKPYEGGYKIVIIWQADRLNSSASNKLLKLIEEPPKDTVFLLITSNYENIINTIQSRCQLIEFPRIDTSSLSAYLKQIHPDKTESEINLAINQSEGNLALALKNLVNSEGQNQFEQWFITWIRAAFKAKGDASVIEKLIDWSNEIASVGRENQKQFLNYCISFFRQALLVNYGVSEIGHLTTKTPGFDISKFAPYIHGSNINAIVQELNEASYHIERNGNAKLILLDCSIKLTRLLHQKE
ncbi:MAG: ATP-binding protein [Flavobacteriaceae bacterium]